MYNASDNYRNLIDNNIRGSWGAIITRGTDTISDDAIKSINKYEQYMTSLSFGNIVSSYVTCEVYGIDLGYYNSSINVDITLEEEVVPLGQFTVFDRPTVINGITKFVAYDNVKRLAKKYETSITYPATIQAVVSEIMTLCGTTITHIIYPDIMITKAFEFDTCAQVMSEICKLIGKNLVANRNGVLEYRWLNTTSLVVDASKHFSLNVSDTVSTLGILKCKKYDETELTSGATGDCLYVNSEYMTQAQLNSILAVSTVTYRYGNCDFVGDPTIDVGDVIIVKDINDVSYPFIVMSNSFSYDGGCKNIIESYDIEEETETISDAVTESKKESKKAQSTANGKNTVYYSQPDSTDNIAENDIWFNADEDNCLYRWTGTKWEKKEVGSMAISYIDAAKVSCEDLASFQATIGGWKINSENIFSDKIMEDGKRGQVYISSNFYTPGYEIPYNPVFSVLYDNDFKFYIRSNGELFAKNATIQGTIISSGGNIGGLEISTNGMSKESNDGLNKVLFRPVQANKSYGVFHVMERTSKDAAWEYPVSINGDGSAKFTKLTVGGNSMLAGWRVTDDIIRKEIEIGGVRYQTCLQAADSVNTTNNIYVRHSSDGVNWDYDFALNYLGRLTTNNVRITGGDINLTGENSSYQSITTKYVDGSYNIKSALSPLELELADYNAKRNTYIQNGGMFIKKNGSTVAAFTDDTFITNSKGLICGDLIAEGNIALEGSSIYYGTQKYTCRIGNTSTGFEFYHEAPDTATTNTNFVDFYMFIEASGERRPIFRTNNNGYGYLGTSGYRWNTAFFTNAITASDRKIKKYITDLESDIARKIVMGANPTRYKMKKQDGSAGVRWKLGMIAQDEHESIKNTGYDFALTQAVILETNEDGEVVERPYDGIEEVDDEKLSWGINYTGYIAPLIKVVQDQQQEIENLKEAIRKIETA